MTDKQRFYGIDTLFESWSEREVLVVWTKWPAGLQALCDHLLKPCHEWPEVLCRRPKSVAAKGEGDGLENERNACSPYVYAGGRLQSRRRE